MNMKKFARILAVVMAVLMVSLCFVSLLKKYEVIENVKLYAK